jgi:hypothetical protein
MVPELLYDGASNNYTDKAKNLGLVMGSNMTWPAHINELSRRQNFSFHSLEAVRKAF